MLTIGEMAAARALEAQALQQAVQQRLLERVTESLAWTLEIIREAEIAVPHGEHQQAIDALRAAQAVQS